MNWFEVDKDGLAEIVARRGKSFVVFELLQNALDCDGAKEISVCIEPVVGRSHVAMTVVDDDPDGFKNLAHAYTLFAPSEKKGDVKKRGRFNLGEKLVLALCTEAEIISTKGGVRFDSDGRHAIRRRRERGTEFNALVKITRDELAQVLSDLKLIMPPAEVLLTINGELVRHHAPLRTFEADLITEVSTGDGVVEPVSLRRTMRRTSVDVHDADGKAAWLFEMGIPVCETGDRWHVDVGQKIPLNLERDGVPAPYLKSIRTLVVNAMHAELTPEDVRKPWVQAALEDKRIERDAVVTIMEQQHGRERVAFDPSDIEGTYIAQSRGITVVPGGTYSAEAWANIRQAEALPPAGQVTPSKPRDFAEARYLAESDLTPAMRRFRRFTIDIAGKVLGADGKKLSVVFLQSPGATTAADWNRTGPRIRFNVSNLGEEWFSGHIRWEQIDLLVHEMAHHGGHHLASGYHKLMSEIAGKVAVLALTQPTLFDLTTNVV